LFLVRLVLIAVCIAWSGCAFPAGLTTSCHLGVSSRTIEHTKQRFVEEGMEAALKRRPSSKPRKVVFGGEFEARLTKLACSPAPEGHARWTIQLLTEKLVELKIVGTTVVRLTDGLRYGRAIEI
jgi:hypothetical protein